MTRPVITTAIVNGVTPNHNAHSLALMKDYDLGAAMNCINALDPQNGILGDGSNEAAALNALYADAVADKLPLWFPPPPVAYGFGSDLLWDSNVVSVLGAGGTAVPFQAIGTAKIIARPDTFTIDQGPTFRGFSVNGDPSSPAGAFAFYTGDITAARWEDLVIKGFNGAGSGAFHFDNVDGWTEVQRFRSVRCDDNTIGVLCSVSGGSNSFARIQWDIHFNLHANQIGFMTTDDALLYEQTGHFDGNAIGNDAVFVDLYDTSSISGWVDMNFEQTTGTGAIGVREENPGFQFFSAGVRNYTETMPEDNGGGKDLLQLPGGLRIKEGLSNSRMGAVALVGGTATVATTATKDAADGQRIHLTSQLGGGTRGHRLEIGTRTPGTSFVIRSVDAAGTLVADTSVIAWELIERY